MRIKELREERGLTQNDVAVAVQTGQSNVARWEKHMNEPSASFVIKLADFFQVSTDYLLGRSDDLGNVSVSLGESAMTEEERRLLSDWRGLAPPLRKILKDMIATWQENTNSISNKRNV